MKGIKFFKPDYKSFGRWYALHDFPRLSSRTFKIEWIPHFTDLTMNDLARMPFSAIRQVITVIFTVNQHIFPVVD